VKIGSDEYIRRERRALGAMQDQFNAPPGQPAAARSNSLSALEEDE
jgi:hypothetical protein